jgi:hypothetical protein
MHAVFSLTGFFAHGLGHYDGNLTLTAAMGGILAPNVQHRRDPTVITPRI